MANVAAVGVQTARTTGAWSMSGAQAATDAAARVAARKLSPPGMAGRCATTENVLPIVSGTRGLRQDTHVLPGVEAIRFGHVTVCQFTDQRKPSLPG